MIEVKSIMSGLEHEEIKMDIFRFPDGDVVVKISNPNNEGSTIILSGRVAADLLQNINGFIKVLSSKGTR